MKSSFAVGILIRDSSGYSCVLSTSLLIDMETNDAKDAKGLFFDWFNTFLFR